MHRPISTRREALGILLALPGLSAHAQNRFERLAASSNKLIGAARAQIGITLHYDPSYVRLTYPLGDVPRSAGVCTDVLIRAYRDAFQIDLQRLVHEDMRRHFASYPKIWGLRRPDPHIDHRRVPNLRTFLTRRRAMLPIPASPSDWQPGDIFTSMIDGKLPHIGIVSNRRARSGRLAVIHNIGQGTREEDALLDHRLTGRYRFLPTS